jgi:hypothetical protein
MTETNFRALCAELLQPLDEYDSANPYHEHRALITRARAALAQPEPVAPTDEEICELADDLGIIRGHGGDLHVSLLDLTPFAESVLTRYARPTIQPVAVSERPWEREGWLDAEGRCWMGHPGDDEFIHSWRLCRPEDAPSMTCSLPYWALPIPTPTP